MELVRSSLEHQPLLALFIVIAAGYLAGEINLRGFSLGVGAVLFVALGVGWFVPASAPAPIIGTLGLALFLYAVGIQYGAQFVRGLTSARGLQANAIASAGVFLSCALAVVVVNPTGLNPGYAMGLFAGSGTSTPTLQAALATMGNEDPAVGYSVAYPFGVAGPILCLYVSFLVLKPVLNAAGAMRMELLEIAVTTADACGRRLGDVTAALPTGVQIVAIRRGGRNQPASPAMIVAKDDILLAVGPSRTVLERVQASLGQMASGRIVADRSALDYLRVFASRRAVVGQTLGALDLPGDRPSVVAHVLRGDSDLQAWPQLVLEYGDRVGLLANRSDFPAMRRFFGDSIKGTAEFSYISIGVGIAGGLILGAISIPLPGVGPIALGLSGVLIVALVLGKLRRTAGMNWTIPISANLVLRNLGLTLFLAQVGMTSGPTFAATVSQTGLQMVALGMLVLFALVLPPLLLGLFVLRMRFDEVAGIVAGACGNPAILAYASRLAPTEATDIGYAMIFPGMTILKILLVTIVPTLF